MSLGISIDLHAHDGHADDAGEEPNIQIRTSGWTWNRGQDTYYCQRERCTIEVMRTTVAHTSVRTYQDAEIPCWTTVVFDSTGIEAGSFVSNNKSFAKWQGEHFAKLEDLWR